MNCKKCGYALRPDARFCPNCGSKVEFVDVQVNSNQVDEFELVKQKIAQQELEEKIKKEEEEKEEERKKRKKEQQEKLKTFSMHLCTGLLVVCILVVLFFSGYSLYNEFTNNALIHDRDEIMLKIDGSLQKNVRIKVGDKTYILGEDGRSQLYKLLVIGDIIKAQDESGVYVMNDTVRINGYFYHFNSEGEALKNEEFDSCYFKNDGKMLVDGWNEDCYYGDDGKMVKDKWIDKYYVGSDGKRLKSSWTPDDFFVNEKGEKVTNNKISFGGKSYFLDSDGKKLLNSWAEVGGKKYHTDDNGVLYTKRKFTENGKTYYFMSDGVMLKNTSADGHYANSSGYLVVDKEVGSCYYDSNGDMVTDRWIGTAYYDNTGTKVLNGWADEYYMINGVIQTNKWVDNNYYYVGSDGKYLKNTVINGCQLGSDGRWTGVVDYGIEISYGNEKNYTYRGNRSKIRRKYYFDDEDYMDYDMEDAEQNVNIVLLTEVISNNGALTASQLQNMKAAVNSCLNRVFDEFKSEVQRNSNISLIDCYEIIVSSQNYNKIRLYCNATQETFSDSTIDASFFVTYDISTNTASKY